MSEQGSLGDPQKNPPCGDFPAGGDPLVPTGLVTTLMEGSQFTVTIDEKIPHPGHYRVAIAQTPDMLPAEPPVTPGVMACGTTVIDPNPALPLLADGQLVHTQAFPSEPNSFMVQLPPGFVCDNCVLQVIEFMSAHPLNNPGGCFYHHCATVTISDHAPDAGVTAGPDAGDTVNPQDAVGGCCSTGSSLAGNGVAILIVGAMLVLHRRRRNT